LGAVEDLAQALLALRRPQDALARLKPTWLSTALRERPWGPDDAGAYRLGRQADALRAYQQVRHILEQELGVDPTPELRRLEEQILRRPPNLAARSARRGDNGGTRMDPADIVFLFTDIEASTRR